MSTRHSRLLTLVCAAVAVAGLSGCLTTMTPPPRFLITTQDVGHLEALTPEESKILVREFADESQGSLTFWRDALKADLIDNRGYRLIEESEVTDDRGHPGLRLVLETTLSGHVVRELMVVTVIPGLCDNTIRVAEFVADREAFDTDVDAVLASFATIH